MMQFKPFKMAAYSQQANCSTAINLHSSNPEPFSWSELAALTQLDLGQIITQSSFNYESTQGNVALREQLAQQLYPSTSAANLVLTSGAQEGIFLVINSLIQAGDEVVTFSPCFEPLVSVAQAAGAQVSSIPLNPQDNWSIPWATLEASITAKTKLLIINFPHNPTGCSIQATELTRLIACCEKHGVWLFSDEVFRGLEHDKQDTLAAVVEQYKRGISMGVMSKSMALPGIRVGWLVCRDQNLLQQWLTIKSHLSICQSSTDAQLTTALIPFTHAILQRNTNIINTNKTLLNHMLDGHPNFKFSLPTGSATAFIELKYQTGEAFYLQTLQEKQLFVMPNPAFMTAVNGFRLTLGKRQAEQHYQTIFRFDTV